MQHERLSTEIYQCSNIHGTVIDGNKTDTLHWRHNDHDSVSNHQPHGCLLNRLFRRRSKKTSKLRVTGLCVGNSPGPVNSPHKGPVTRKMFPFDDVIMICLIISVLCFATIWSQRSVKNWNSIRYLSADIRFVTRGQFLPSGSVIACVCVCIRVCVSLCVNHLLVRAITRDPFKLGSPNLDTLVKIPIVFGVIVLDLQGHI